VRWGACASASARGDRVVCMCVCVCCVSGCCPWGRTSHRRSPAPRCRHRRWRSGPPARTRGFAAAETMGLIITRTGCDFPTILHVPIQLISTRTRTLRSNARTEGPASCLAGPLSAKRPTCSVTQFSAPALQNAGKSQSIYSLDHENDAPEVIRCGRRCRRRRGRGTRRRRGPASSMGSPLHSAPRPAVGS
jgi:hypothetical protein